MRRTHFIELVRQFASSSGDSINFHELSEAALSYSDEAPQDFQQFVFQFQEIADSAGYHFQLRTLTPSDLLALLKNDSFPLLVFKNGANTLEPLLIQGINSARFRQFDSWTGRDETEVPLDTAELSKRFATISTCVRDYAMISDSFSESEMRERESRIVVFSGFRIQASEVELQENSGQTPVKRFFKLLDLEKKDIYTMYFFAILVALITLTIPLGIQAVIGLVSGGLLLESAVLLIILIILATLGSGWLQVQQLSLVEILQQRIFTRTAFEFSYRIPRIKSEVLDRQYTPELVNRFFDVLNVQKSLPKILIDFASALIQIIFGLILLSLYHYSFIFFGLSLFLAVSLVFVFTGKKALETSIQESKYKYKLAFWLEEIGRSLHAFKMAANTGLPVNKTDKILDKYLYYRRKHFGILVKQFMAVIGFKTAITAGLLILGATLVVNREINLGQFVASEIIIMLIISSVEKIISNISNIYDVLTAIDKLGTVTDLPIEPVNGRVARDLVPDGKIKLEVSNLSFAYPDAKNNSIEGLNFAIYPGKKIALVGTSDSGKSTLLKILSGLYHSDEGAILLNGVSLREVNLNSYRNLIADTGNLNDLFEGTIEDNICMGNPQLAFSEIVKACELSCLNTFLGNLDKGLKTEITPGATNFPSNIGKKILLARAFVANPSLMLIDDLFNQINQSEKQEILDHLFAKADMSLLLVSSHPSVLRRCDEIWVMSNGRISSKGNFEELKKAGLLDFIIFE